MAEEALLDGWNRRRTDGENFEILGRTVDGEYLQLMAREYADHLWVFHGRRMTREEKRRYRRGRKL